MQIAAVNDETATPPRAIRDTSDTDVVLEPRSNRRLWIISGVAGLLLLLAIVAAGPVVSKWSRAEISVPLERLRLSEVSRGDFVRDVGVQGVIVAAVSPTLFAPAEGTVALTIKAGDQVTIGDVVARIDSPNLSNELLQEDATLQSLTTELERQRIEFRRQQLLNQQTIDLAQVTINAAERELRRADAARQASVISKQDYEKAVDDVDTSRLHFEHARQNAALEKDEMTFELKADRLTVDRQQLLVENLRRRVDDLSIRSPANGMVGNLMIDQNSAVAANQPLLTVVDLSAFEVEMRVPESYGNDLALAMSAEIIYGGQSYPGIVTAVSPEVQSSQVTGRIRFAGEMPDGLRQNQRVSVRILLEQSQDVLMVQRGPFVDSGAGRIAYVVENGVAHRTSIEIGASSIESLQIIGGLKEGDTIIISGIGEFDGAETVYISD